MAGVLARSSFKTAGGIGNLLGKQVKPVLCVCPIQVATMRATWGEPFGYHPNPFPYKKKRFNNITEWLDNTKKRLNENSKIIIVDGNVAVGKNEFSKRLAKAFDLRHYPTVKPERVFVDLEHVFDCRDLNDMLPKSCRFYDLNDFYSEKNPSNGRIAKMQMYWYWKKFENYCTACLHLLSTGQGVVMTGSPFSDIVYVDALKKMGYITPSFHKWMAEFYKDTICELMPPHLSIYLDSPIDVIRDRINKRNDLKEVNSKVLNDDYLRTLDQLYKTNFLSKMKKTGEVVQIDWSEVGDDLDHDTIAEEIELLVLENTDPEDPKFRDWKQYKEDDLARFRKIYSNPDCVNEYYIRDLPFDCPELSPDDDDWDDYQRLVLQHPALAMAPGYAKTKKGLEDIGG